MYRLWTPRSERLAWGAVGLALFAVVAFIVHAFVGAIVSGVFLYYAVRPVYRWLDGRIARDNVTATVTLLTVGVPILLVLAAALLVGLREANEFLQTAQFERYRALVGRYLALVSLTGPDQVLEATRNNAGQVASITGTAVAWLLRLLVLTVVAFYLLRDDDQIAAWVRDSFGDDNSAVVFFEGVDADLTTLYTGNLLTVAITAGIAVATLYAFDLVAPGNVIGYPFLLGLLIGVATLVPVIGIKLVYLPIAAYLFAQSLLWNARPLWVPVAFLLAVAVVVDFVPDVFIRSYVSKGELHMGLVLLAYVLGTVAFGWYGIFLAPIVLVLSLHFVRRILPNIVDERAVRMIFE